MLFQSLSVVGALLVLAGFALLQLGRIAREDRIFNLLNFVGSALLTVVAVEARTIGFIVLEGAWAVLSLVPLLRPPARRGASG